MIPRILFVVDTLTEHELRRQRPLLDRAGAELEHWLRKYCRLEREDVQTTAFFWEPVKNQPKPGQITAAKLEFDERLHVLAPDIIVPFGIHATRHLLGDWVHMDMVYGLPHQTWAVVLPIPHPMSPNYELFTWGMEQLGKFLRGEIGIHEIDTDPVYYHDNQDERLCGFDIRWGCDMHGIITIDTEGSAENPWCLTFSMEDRVAGLIRASQHQALGCFQRQIEEVGAMGGTVAMHYAPHDLRVLEAMGVHIDTSKIQVLDTMQLAYIAGRLPQGLKALAYRLCGMKMREYGDLIEVHDRRVATEWLSQYISDESFLAAIPKRDATTFKKFLTSTSPDPLFDRWQRSVLSERYSDMLGPMPKATLDDVPFEEVLQYACTDADATRRVFLKLREYFD